MKNAALPIVTLLLSTVVIACSQTPAKVWQTEAVEDLNLEKGVALRGMTRWRTSPRTKR